MSLYEQGGVISAQQYEQSLKTQKQYNEEQSQLPQPSAPDGDPATMVGIYGVMKTEPLDLENAKSYSSSSSDNSNLSICICAFLTLIIIVLIVLISLKSKNNTSRLTSKENQILYFMRPGCGYCDKFNPIWDEFTKTLNADVKLKYRFTPRKIDCSDAKLSALCVKEREYGMRGVPHVVRIMTDGNREVFKDARTVDKLMEFVKSSV